MDKGDNVGVLLDRAGFAQVGEDRLFVAASLLGGAGELERATTGMFSSLASALRPREMEETSWVRFS